MRGHVDGETMAAFREGLLPARKATRIAAHLSSCPRCAEVDAQLAAVTAILASTPVPPMPASLAARLDAALAAEVAGLADAGAPGRADPAAGTAPGPQARAAQAGTTTPRGGTASPEGTGPPGGTAPPDGTAARHGTGPGRRAGRPRAGPRLALRLAAVTAAVVLVAGGGYAVTRVISAGGIKGEASSSGTAASPALPGGQPPSAPSARAAPGAAAETALPVITSGTSYQPGQLKAQVSAVLKRHPAPAKARGELGSGTGPQAAFPDLAACVSHLSGGRQPMLIDIARYGNRPAAVIVVPAAGSPTVQVWVVGPGCSGQGGDVIAQTSLPAPG